MLVIVSYGVETELRVTTPSRVSITCDACAFSFLKLNLCLVLTDVQ